MGNGGTTIIASVMETGLNRSRMQHLTIRWWTGEGTTWETQVSMFTSACRLTPQVVAMTKIRLGQTWRQKQSRIPMRMEGIQILTRRLILRRVCISRKLGSNASTVIMGCSCPKWQILIDLYIKNFL